MFLQPHKDRSTQLDLFQTRPTMPSWQNLPTEVRRKVLPLLAHLLRTDRRVAPRPDDREVGHE
jgi:hypothetical protein